MKKQQIALLDCNNFFVSCERLFRPDLIEKPVLVLSANDGCVVARSQEVKDIGIPMGVPYFKIKDIVQEYKVQVFSGHLALYRDVSRRVFEVLREQVDQVQQYSVDEAFFVIPTEQDAEVFCRRVSEVVEREVGVPVSIGVGLSKTQAKCAGDIAKKTDGVHVLQEPAWQELVTALPIASIWGVGAGQAKRFSEHQINTVADLLAVAPERVRTLFGVVGARLQAELSGTPCSLVEHSRPLQKSLMSSRSFSQVTENKDILADALAYHARHIAAELRSMQAGATTMRVSLRTNRHGDFFLRGGGKEVVFTQPTNDTFTLIEQATRVMEELYESGVPYQKVGITMSGIQPLQGAMQTLFDDDEVDNQELLKAVDALNTAAGNELVTVGSRLQTKAWQAKSDMRSPAYTTRWSDIATVSA